MRFKLMCGLNLEFIPYKGQAMTEQQMPSDEAINLKKSVEHNPAKNIQHKLDENRIVMMCV